MDLEQIKNYLEENKDSEDVQALLQGFSSTNKDDVEVFLDTEEGKKLLQPKLDKYHAKGLDSWKANNLDKLVNDKLKELNPDKTPEAIELEQIKQQLVDMENEKTREILKNKALTVATEKNIPTSIIDHFLGDTEESTIENLGKFEEAMKTYVDTQVKERINDSSYTPPSNNDKTKTFTKEQVSAMSTDEINENWDDIKDIIGQE